jgi:chromosome segregation ATPase
MTEKSNGHDPLTVEMVSLLREIRDEAKRTNERLGSVDERLGSVDERLGNVEQRLGALEGEVRGLRGELNLRLDAFLEHVTEDKTGLEERVKKLEAAVFKPTRPRSTRGARR